MGGCCQILRPKDFQDQNYPIEHLYLQGKMLIKKSYDKLQSFIIK